MELPKMELTEAVKSNQQEMAGEWEGQQPVVAIKCLTSTLRRGIVKQPITKIKPD